MKKLRSSFLRVSLTSVRERTITSTGWGGASPRDDARKASTSWPDPVTSTRPRCTSVQASETSTDPRTTLPRLASTTIRISVVSTLLAPSRSCHSWTSSSTERPVSRALAFRSDAAWASAISRRAFLSEKNPTSGFPPPLRTLTFDLYHHESLHQHHGKSHYPDSDRRQNAASQDTRGYDGRQGANRRQAHRACNQRRPFSYQRSEPVGIRPGTRSCIPIRMRGVGPASQLAPSSRSQSSRSHDQARPAGQDHTDHQSLVCVPGKQTG